MEKQVAHPELLDQISAFISEHNMSETGFGVAALNDPNFVSDLRQGRECRMGTRRSVMDFIAKKASAA